MKKIKEYKVSIIFIVTIVMIFMAMIISFYTINRIKENNKEDILAYVENNFEVELYENSVLVIVSRTNGISSIKYNNKDDVETYLQGNNKDKVAIDYPIILNKQFNLEIEDGNGNITTDHFKITEDIKINVNVSYTDYVIGNMQLELSSVGNINQILINNSRETIPSKVNGKYTLNKELSENGTYTIIVRSEDNSFARKIISVSEISEDMDIYTLKDLTYFRDRVNNGATYGGRTIRLMNSLDLSSICGQNKESWASLNNFSGIFNGNNYNISNLYINSNENNIGFFSNITGNGQVENLNLINVNIKGGDNTGDVAGNLNSIGTIKNCTISGTISGGRFTGGIFGRSKNGGPAISNCKVTANVTGTCWTGGIAGVSNRSIEYCAMYGNTTSTSYYTNPDEFGFAGGIIAELCEGHIYSCVNKGDVKGYTYVGGIAADIRTGTYISCCYNTGSVTATGVQSRFNVSYCGGIVAESYGDISKCFSTNIVSAKGRLVGGILGCAQGPTNVQNVIGLADVYQDNVHVGSYAWDYNESGGLYGRSVNITYENHYYVNGEHTIKSSLKNWFTPEFVENPSTPGVLKLNWE